MTRLIALSQFLARFIRKGNGQGRRDIWLRLLRSCCRCWLLIYLCDKQVGQMGLDGKTRLDGVAGSVGLDFGRVNVEFFSPDQASLLALLDNCLKEAAEDIDAIALTDTRQAGMIG